MNLDGVHLWIGCLIKIVYEESLVSDIEKACLMEVGYKSIRWARCNHVCDKFGLWDLVNLLWLMNINKEGFCGENPGVWQETVEEWIRHK